MKNKGAKQKLKRKGAASAFGCDLTEYLESSGQDVPYVLKSCAEFIETHGIVDGIYRLSGITSNIQRLRQEFGSDQCPDLTREVYLQDIHCVGSLCKLYFRELPNPLLTYELYEKFTEAVSHRPEEGQLARIQNVILELPPPHYRTLEYLIRHLAHIASFSSKTNMHARNLALVWAPNLLRSKKIEATICNGDAAFLAVRVQQVVIEFILNHADQIFNGGAPGALQQDESRTITKSLTLPALSLPMKLVSLEEAQARSLATNHPARKERRENSLPEIVPPPFHTVLELPDNKRKLSSKSKKWKSIFNLGRSGSDSKSKLSRNGSVFVRGQRLSVEKATIRPAKSMDSLCSVPVEGKENKGNFSRTVTTGGFFIPATKMHASSTGSSCDLSKEGEWGQEGMPAGAEGGCEVGGQIRPLPEQLKVFRPIGDPESEQSAPKLLGMFYTSSDSPGKSVFTSSLFQMEPSPRHQRKALNISEPFAVSVPLRVSAVISTNSTPCRTPPKELQSLSSLEEFSFQGSESGGWPEEEKPLGAESFPGSVTKKAATEDTKPEPEVPGRAECSQSPPLDPGTQVEKKTLHVSLGSQVSKEAEKRPKAEKVMEESQGASQPKPSTPQESLGAGTEPLILHEMDEEDLAQALIWPEIQQELKIIESEEEFSSLPPAAQKTSPIPESSPAPFPFPEAPGSLPSSSAPREVWTRDAANQSIQEAAILTDREKLEPVCSLLESESQQELSPDPASLAPLEMLLFEKVSSPARIEIGGPRNLSPPLTPAPPPPTPLEEEPEVLLSKEGPDREDAARDSRTDVYTEQPTPKESPGIPTPCQREEAIASPNEKQNARHAVPENKGPGLPSPTKEVDIIPQEEGGAPHSAQEPSDCDEDDTVTDPAQHGLEMVEPWEEPQWVTSPLHSPTLKEVQESQTQGSQGHRLERRLCHRPSLRQSHSLDSKTTGNSHWTLEAPFSSSCANLETERNYEPLQPPAARTKIAGLEEKALKAFREFSGLKGLEVLPSQKGPSGIQPKPVETNFMGLAEGKEQEPQLELSNRQMKHSDVPGPDSSKESSPRAQDSTLPGEHPLQLQLKNTECGPSKGKHRPSSLNLDSATPIADLFRLENGAPFSSPGIELSELGDTKVTWMSSSHCKAAPWNSQDTQDLDIVAHTLTGRRNSAPVSVSAVRTSFMVKMCQAKAVPVIPPKIQYTQIPQPLPSQSTGEGGAQPLERSQEEPGSTPEIPQKSTKDDSPSSLGSPEEEQPKQETGASASRRQASITSCMYEGSSCSPEPSASTLASTQDAVVQCRKRTSETEPSGDNLLSSKLERASGGPKAFHRSRPGRPQSLILFPIMDHLPSSPTVIDSKVLLSPIRSPTQTVSPGLLCGELAENTWITPEGVTLRNKMTIPKNGQRLETSTSCFYQPQRRSVILDGRSGRQIE
ncbi:rho GTPase-activating protein 31 [Mus musculus]|uniref:Rho GTPase-activating protein 31 n=2 Tax=Mus musculus TaxID=10090 RepID=RHG31_MOUSE|nr:rho GTPase-activating protein 31 [Mus musculus]A6X8Z5.1 RecName: Full=Rho GTPase-activating protein 31; AltName: Full=Cdc42 GTPase-activating protein [Mus musculus]AAI38871.1 CDC42 GTPase-activating protein [Mus musculus]EDK97988.1 Cdc42 GTPase-activating protein, isoform CRA_a [Mus musculus]|eukprot:NP_064656.2 rho GTPase-activating protein 31 [Mus musculus]